MKIAEFFDKYTSDWKKAATLGVMLLVIIIAVWIVIKMFGTNIKNLFSKAQNQLQQNAAMNTIEQRYPNQTKSYTTYEYQSMADRLYNAFKGLGTDDNVVMDVMRQMKNDLDVYALIDAFGTKQGAWPQRSFSGTLPTWMSDEMSTSELAKINSILSSKGIEYRF